MGAQTYAHSALLLIFSFVLVGCGSEASFVPRTPPSTTMPRASDTQEKKAIQQTPYFPDRASCMTAGGLWGTFGPELEEACNPPTTDAGKLCETYADCDSICVTDDNKPKETKTKGQCYGYATAQGICVNRVKDGVAQGIICSE